MDVKILIATHKKYKMPTDSMYVPIQVGKEIHDDLGYIGDNIGYNISSKNPYFCELTALYYAYKNMNNDYIGLVHYRRHFSLKRICKDKYKNILTKEQLEKLLEKTDVIVPKKRHYIFETIYTHYKYTMYVEPLLETEKIIEEKYSEYLESFKLIYKKRSAHLFNMFIMKKEMLDQYSKWLFDILFELEKRVNNNYNEFHSRFYGRISEMLLDVWLNTNNIHYKEVPFINIEKDLVIKKGIRFLKAKYLNKKYEKSF